jgi:hypothetical protein
MERHKRQVDKSWRTGLASEVGDQRRHISKQRSLRTPRLKGRIRISAPTGRPAASDPLEDAHHRDTENGFDARQHLSGRRVPAVGIGDAKAEAGKALPEVAT